MARDDQPEQRQPRGPRYFDPSLDDSEGWYPPRPPDDDERATPAPEESPPAPDEEISDRD